MENDNQQMQKQLSSQLVHWELAIDRLSDLNEVASPGGWNSLERQTNVILRASILQSIRALRNEAVKIRADIGRFSDAELVKSLHALRKDYLRTETMLDFFADAINSRTSEQTGRILLGLDRIAHEGMRRILEPLGYSVPPVITYIDKGLGASILKAGLRLWDKRSINPAATIKVVRHNLFTATSVLHELGHQVAHITEWNDELRKALKLSLPGEMSDIWSSWATEVAADAIAFVYAGHASLSALRNVVDGGNAQVFRFIPGDPHPIGMLRVLMVSQFAKSAIAPPLSHAENKEQQPWLLLEKSWISKYPLRYASAQVTQIIQQSIPLLPKVADIVLKNKYKAFDGKALIDLVDPGQVAPTMLDRFEREVGPRAFELPYVVTSDPIRLLALSGLRITSSLDGRDYYEKQRRALQVLGHQAVAA